MSVNIMDLVKGAVSDQVMGQIGGLLGTDAKKTPSIFETAAGSILGGLIKKGSTQQGAQDIFGQVEKQDDSILDKLGDLMGGGDGTDELQKQGSGILDMVLGGGQETNGMIQTIAKALGLDEGIIGKLLMMAAPIVMGVIGKHLKAKAMDAVGLGDLLGQQKSHLANVMPASLTNDLGFGDMLGNAGDAVSNASRTVTGAANTAGAMAGDAAKSGGGLFKVLIPIALLAAAALYFGPMIMDYMSMSGKKIDPSEITAATAEGQMDLDFSSVPGLDSLGDAGKTLSTGFSDITTKLQDLNDEAGATSLVDKLKDFTGQIDGLGLDKFEGAAKNVTSGLISRFITAVKGILADKSEGIQGILKPVVDALLEKLSPFNS
jgi:hypothetical protein